MSVRVGMVVEQMWQPVPGGSGRYIVEVASRLAAQGVRAVGVAALPLNVSVEVEAEFLIK